MLRRQDANKTKTPLACHLRKIIEVDVKYERRMYSKESWAFSTASSGRGSAKPVQN
jgi:hypothetical protein